jgi:UDP-N-acetylglucosamine transferase subunit ALG13
LLRAEFPLLEIVELGGYNITYSRTRAGLAFKMLGQVPKILRAIRHEHRWLTGFLEKRPVDVVISDNRYGLWSKTTPCIFITHQLQIQTPVLQSLARRIHYRFINRFSECRVPDYASPEQSLAGALSHPRQLPALPVRYIGPLCRFRKLAVEPVFDWLIILSGPEPQRTLLEERAIAAARAIRGKVCLVRALPGEPGELQLPEHMTVYNHAGTALMEQLIAQSRFILSRSGYTTVMEMMVLQKTCLFVPTPGQTEQEFLAAHLQRQQLAFTCGPHEDLLQAMQRVAGQSGRIGIK